MPIFSKSWKWWLLPFTISRQYCINLNVPSRQRCQSYKSGRASRVGFGFGPGSGPKLTKISGLIRALDVLFVFGAQ